MWCTVKDQSVEQVIQSRHETQQGDEHGDTERDADSGYQGLFPPSK
jgi:hypothetical protein